MGKYNTKTKQEKERLLNEFHSSGMSITNWCKSKNIPCSTFSKWLNKEKANNTFIPLNVNKSQDKTRNTTAQNDVIKLNVKGIDVEVSSYTSLILLKDLLKVVFSIDV